MIVYLLLRLVLVGVFLSFACVMLYRWHKKHHINVCNNNLRVSKACSKEECDEDVVEAGTTATKAHMSLVKQIWGKKCPLLSRYELKMSLVKQIQAKKCPLLSRYELKKYPLLSRYELNMFLVKQILAKNVPCHCQADLSSKCLLSSRYELKMSLVKQKWAKNVTCQADMG